MQLVTKNIWRGKSPDTIEDWDDLDSKQIKFILNLESVERNKIIDEFEIADMKGITSLYVPMGVIFPPSQKHLEIACKIIDENQPIYVHCKSGVDRTGMTIAWYKMTRMGVSRESAVAEMRAMGMHWWYRWWSSYL